MYVFTYSISVKFKLQVPFTYIEASTLHGEVNK